MDLQEIKRKYFRITFNGNDAFSIKIYNIPYKIIDLSDSGIGIRLTAEDILVAEGDELPLELGIANQVHKLRGKVVHVSPSGVADLYCGIEFINIDTKIKAKLLEYLKSYREKIFKED